jgi:hypothetical protein
MFRAKGGVLFYHGTDDLIVGVLKHHGDEAPDPFQVSGPVRTKGIPAIVKNHRPFRRAGRRTGRRDGLHGGTEKPRETGQQG